MFEKMSESSGNVLGLRAVGVIKRSDYAELTSLCENLIAQDGSINILFDLAEFEFEEPVAWGADFHLGHEFHDKIERMAIVGDKRWEKWMTAFCQPFYAKEAQYFHTADRAAAWDWLREEKSQAA